MSSFKRAGQPLRLKAHEMSKAIRAGEMLDQLMGRSGVASGGLPPALVVRAKNAGEDDIPAWGLCRWFGNPIQPATIGGTVPELVLRTTTDTDRPMGVAVNQIKAADSPNPAEIGQVQIMGVCWCRCRGPITADDLLMPDSSFRGIKDTDGGSNVRALATILGETDSIIPVLIGAGGASVSSTFVRIYTLAIRGTADSGTIDWEARKTVIVDDEPTTVTETGTWDFDSVESDIQTSLEVIDPDVLVIGGDIRWNVCKIRFSDPTARLSITATSLTREEHGITPQAELSWCAENENAWWE